MKTVDDVPRYDSIAFQDAVVTPGGCASNVAIGLDHLGGKPLLVACMGDDQTAEILVDAFAAGLVSALRRGKEFEEACRFGAKQGALTTGFLGAVRQDQYIEGL